MQAPCTLAPEPETFASLLLGTGRPTLAGERRLRLGGKAVQSIHAEEPARRIRPVGAITEIQQDLACNRRASSKRVKEESVQRSDSVYMTSKNLFLVKPWHLRVLFRVSFFEKVRD